MILSTWHPNLAAWLEANVLIDSWFIDNPALGQTLAFLPPIQGVAIAVGANGLEAKGTQWVHLRRRYPRSLRFTDLPIAQLEGTWQTLSMRAISVAYGWGLTGLEIGTSDPVAIIEASASNSDWLIELSWKLEMTWLAAADPMADLIGDESGDGPYSIAQLDAGLYAQPIPGGPDILEANLTLP